MSEPRNTQLYNFFMDLAMDKTDPHTRVQVALVKACERVEQLEAQNERLKLIISSGERVVNDAANQAEARLHAEAEAERLRDELAAEQKAHDEIAKICFAAGVEDRDGTSIGAVKNLRDEVEDLRQALHAVVQERDALRARMIEAMREAAKPKEGKGG